jgi:hypothetical protein
MDHSILRPLIREKLSDGRLPHDNIPRVWGGLGHGGPCDGCEGTVTETEMGIEGSDAKGSVVQFHVACFYAWEAERRVPGLEPSFPA